ncbi:Peptide-N4-(N-acetyl-beta-glucosaminyl)asparagine amidase A [Scenedesmus sp. PABB004]|nr:Peptide-N4-(N-acetyl-beta-glucosaminyl)asparagine amidase A [Scenedesmus sp. PABB004]
MAAAAVLFALAAGAALAGAAPVRRFPVYADCPGKDAPAGAMCRQELGGARRGPGAAAAAAAPPPAQLPVDMRFPCEDPNIPCDLNIDVVQPVLPPAGESCSDVLMPWAPFPCTFDANRSTGVPGQPTDLCGAGFSTDGYTNLFRGFMPDRLCSGGAAVDKLLLTVDFRVANGRQFDRTYSYQFGSAVAAFGTCSEPSRLIRADKRWSVTVDVSHLASYIRPGQPTRFALANVLDNTYNVPIWATARLEAVFTAKGAPPWGTAAAARRVHAAASAGARGAASPQLPAGAPDQVIPLVLPPASTEPYGDALTSVAGSGDRPAFWPNVTFPLPASVLKPGSITRAAVTVVPKANGCEEFWAMTPSGAATNSTCGGLSTGEPYREVRLYVDGQLAGSYPIFYTMYTGGVDPRLWTAIVAAYAYSLPGYTFDLLPWLGLLNCAGSDHTITVEVFGATGADWVLASTLLLWHGDGPAPASVPGASPTLRGSGALALANPGVSVCSGDDLAVAGTCRMALRAREMSVETVLRVGGELALASVSYRLDEFDSTITYDNADGTSSWRVTALHSARWLLSAGAPHHANAPHPPWAAVEVKRGAAAHEQHATTAWLQAGGVADGAVFEISLNRTADAAGDAPWVRGACRHGAARDARPGHGGHGV